LLTASCGSPSDMTASFFDMVEILGSIIARSVGRS
jgi:hypothetical protein